MSTPPKVLNVRMERQAKSRTDCVYIGRPSKWGNPFVIGPDGDRATVIRKYRAFILAHPDLVADARKELVGKNLVCFCAPQACHGDVLLEIANPELKREGAPRPPVPPVQARVPGRLPFHLPDER